MNLPEGSADEYIAEQCGDEGFDCDLLRAVAEANRKWGGKQGLGHASVIDDWLELTPIERAAALSDLRKIVLTDKGTLKVSAGQSKAEPHYEAHAGRLANLVAGLLRIQNGGRLAGDMAAGLRAGQAFAVAYTRAKRAAGVADFNDLIEWTRMNRQHMHVLLLSGDVARKDVNDFAKSYGVHFLSKPFSVSELTKAVQRLSS